MPTPFVLGNECAGRVLAVGEGVSGFGEGDLVASASTGGGSHATHVLLAAETSVHVPDGVDAETAAAAMLQGMTAHYLVHSTFAVTEGQTVLVHAAAGGVGLLLVQMAKAQGARVIGTVGSAAKATIAAAAGADVVLRYDEVDDLAAAVRDEVPDGVEVVYDGVGQATFEASLASLRPRGLLALFGAASGQVPPFDLQRLNPAGSLFVTRPTPRALHGHAGGAPSPIGRGLRLDRRRGAGHRDRRPLPPRGRRAGLRRPRGAPQHRETAHRSLTARPPVADPPVRRGRIATLPPVSCGRRGPVPRPAPRPPARRRRRANRAAV